VTKYQDGWSIPVMDTSFAANTSDLSISESGNLACFTSWDGTYDQYTTNTDIWVSERTGAIWGEPEILPAPVNSAEQEWGACILDNRTVYVCQRNGSHSDIVKYVYDNGSYSPVYLNEINSSYFEWDPYIPEDESYIIFKSDRHSNDYEMDLYISYRKEDGSYTNPKGLGSKINTPEQEDCGNLTPDGKYFIFARGSSTQNTVDLYWVSSGFIDSLKLTNYVPYVKNPIPNQTVYIDSLFEYTIPDSVFFDDDGNETFTISVEGELPEWLYYEEETTTLFGTPLTEETESITVTATDNAGASVSDIFTLIVRDVTSADAKTISDNMVSVYPNPADRDIRIKLDDVNRITDYQIISRNGLLLKQGELNSGIIDISDLKKGIYLIKLKTGETEISRMILAE
jgi:hypothetical protein